VKHIAALASVAAFLLSAVPAHAEIVFFGSGRTLSVKGHRTEEASLVLTLRGGGEIVCDPSVVTRIDPDEVPYPEPEAPPAVATTIVESAAPPPAVPSQYAAIIDRVSLEQGVPATLVRAVIQVESAYRENARSPKGAMGLMQLMPDTARMYALANPYDPAANIEAGIKHLKSLLLRFPRPLALAAYNAGEAAVLRFGGIPPYAETRNYVSRILKLVG
jgi:soluble lytic murein transglycosylase-like protein